MVIEDDARKPDPDEPWRYVCPQCEGQVTKQASSVSYRCGSCKTSWKKRELVDLKNKR